MLSSNNGGEEGQVCEFDQSQSGNNETMCFVRLFVGCSSIQSANITAVYHLSGIHTAHSAHLSAE